MISSISIQNRTTEDEETDKKTITKIRISKSWDNGKDEVDMRMIVD